MRHDLVVIMSSSALMRSTLHALADAWALVAPVDCAGCGAPDRPLCPACALDLRSRPLLGALELAPQPQQVPVLMSTTMPIVAALTYEGVVRRVVLALKEQGRTELARALAVPLAVAVERAWSGSGAELLVPVPGSWAGAGRRGFEPVSLIARRAGFVVTPALRAARPGVAGQGGLARRRSGVAPGHQPLTGGPQKSRTLAERLGADAPRWRVSPRVRGRRVVLVDDVVTSGATLRAAALALIAAGAEVAGCAAIAATPRRVGTSSIPWRLWTIDDQGHNDNDTATGLP